MPIFVSRFSPTRTGLANFQALRTSVEDARREIRASFQENRAEGRNREEDQSVSGGEAGGASPLLITSQRADEIAQSITNDFSRASGSQAETTPTTGETTASIFSSPAQETVQASAFPEVSTAGGAVQAALQNAGEQTAPAGSRQTTAGGQAPQETPRQSGRAAGRQGAAARQTQVQRRESPQQTRVVIRPFLRSAVQRIDGLSRLLSAQRRSEEPAVPAEPAVAAEPVATADLAVATDLAVTAEPAIGTEQVAQALSITSLRVEQTAAQSNIVRTAQAVQVAEAQQAAQAAQAAVLETAQPPSVEERLQETTQLKQTLREDMATVTRGLVRDVARQSTQNARQIAQNTLRAATQQARPTAARVRPVTQNLFSSSPRRQSFTISNLSPLRSALALLGTNVNILVG